MKNRSRRSFLRTTAVGTTGMLLGASGSAARADVRKAPAARSSGTTGDSGKSGIEILMLGGTRFLGPALVEHALARGHSVTLFNRGKSNPDMFPGLEKLKGDRDPDKGEGLNALEGRTWDAVIDTSGYFPRMVRASAELLAPSVGQYVFVSTLSVYAETAKIGIDENDPVATMDDPTLEEMGDQFQYYGPLKALCEQAAEAAMPGRATTVRPGLIVGYRDSVPRFTYWPVRVERGGEVLSPGTPDDPVQYIDVRDLAAFVVHTIENRITGVFNTNGPTEAPTNIGEVLYGCKAVTGGSATFTWAEAGFLEQHEVQPWAQMPLWIPPSGEYAGFHRMSCKKAIEAGLGTRPLAETVRETLAWFHEWPKGEPFPWRGGMEPDAERKVLAAWHARSKKKSAPPAAAEGARSLSR